MRLAVAFVAGAVFAIGLGLSGMTNPERILGFLDVAGRWDPSLAFVMLGAIGVHLVPARWAARAPRPLLGGDFDRPVKTATDSARRGIGAVRDRLGCDRLLPGAGDRRSGGAFVLACRVRRRHARWQRWLSLRPPARGPHWSRSGVRRVSASLK